MFYDSQVTKIRNARVLTKKQNKVIAPKILTRKGAGPRAVTVASTKNKVPAGIS
jgi:hypothetical protein